MARKDIERGVEKRPTYSGYDLSPMSEYYIYGRGNAGDYGRAVKGLREDIREIAYGERRDGSSLRRPQQEEKKRINGKVVLVAFVSLLAIVFLVVGMCLPSVKILTLAGGKNALNLWSMLIDGEIKGSDLAAVAVTVGLAVSALCLVVTFVTAICKSRAKKTGGWLKLVASLSCLTTVWAPLALMLSKDVNGIGNTEIGYWIYVALTFLTALAALVGREK